MKSAYIRGSPPDRVTPPWSFYKTPCLSGLPPLLHLECIPSRQSPLRNLCRIERSPPLKLHLSMFVVRVLSFISMALFSHALIQFPHKVHLLLSYKISLTGLWLSGLWHHKHLKGHPLKNTVVLIPGPSWIENFCMLNIFAFIHYPRCHGNLSGL